MKAVACILLAALAVTAQFTSDPTDRVLIAHRLSPDEEAAFSARDNRVSPFWDHWLGRDYIVLIPPRNCRQSSCFFDGAGDANVTAKAAVVDSGVCLYVRVGDDAWLTGEAGDFYKTDVVELFFDQLGSKLISRCTDCLIGLFNSALSYTHRNIRVYMGDSTGAKGFQLCYKDPNLWSYSTVHLAAGTGREVWGIELESVEIDSTTRVLEGFVPWRFYDLPSSPCPGDLLGFVVGYNDRDVPADSVGMLRWMGGDPWSTGAQAANYWGDLAIGRGQPCDPAWIRITAPNGGEQLLAGQAHTITWEQGGHIPYVAIDYSIDSGLSWIRKNPGHWNQGHYDAFDIDTVSSGVLVRVSDPSDGIPADTSDTVFSLVRTLAAAPRGAGVHRLPVARRMAYDLHGRRIASRAPRASGIMVVQQVADEGKVTVTAILSGDCRKP